MRDIKSVCVYCGSSSKVDNAYFEAARELGKLLADRGIRLVYGAGNQGLMGEVANSVLDNGGEVLGIIPQFMHQEGWHHTGLSELRIVESMHQRKAMMAAEADATIALAGGCGTLEELLEIITWKQLGLYFNPIVLLNTNNYYTPLDQMLQRAITENFMRAEHGTMWQLANTPLESLEAIANAPIWSGEVRKFAAI